MRIINMADNRVVEITSDKDFVTKVAQAKRDGAKVVVDFSASWCGPCKQIAPVFAALSIKYPQILFWKVDGDKCTAVCQSLGVRAYPTFHFYAGDTLVMQLSGADKSKLEASVTKLASASEDELKKIAENGEQVAAKDTFIEGNLHTLLDDKRSECLNDSSEFPYSNLFSDDAKLCKSDTDEQILLNLAYTQVVTVKSIKFSAPAADGPKTVKLFVNRLSMGFDEAQSDSPVQTIVLKATDLAETAPAIQLDVVKFRKTDKITIFIEDNQSTSQQTVIQKLILSGTKA